MYVPSSVPENQEETETPLKKILLWNGASSWGGKDKKLQDCTMKGCKERLYLYRNGK